MFEKKVRVDALFDFYGQMLTEKQREVMDLYCNLDYSLGEISELLNISRQAVHDVVKRTEKALERYENELGLHKRFIEKQMVFETLYEMILTFERDREESTLESIKSILKSELE